eukprot:gene30037-36275_t
MSVIYGDDFDEGVEDTPSLVEKEMPRASHPIVGVQIEESTTLGLEATAGPEYSLDFDQEPNVNSIRQDSRSQPSAAGPEYSLDFDQEPNQEPLVNSLHQDSRSQHSGAAGPEYSLDFDQEPNVNSIHQDSGSQPIVVGEIDANPSVDGAHLASALDYSLDFDTLPDATTPANAEQLIKTESADYSYDFDQTSPLLPSALNDLSVNELKRNGVDTSSAAEALPASVEFENTGIVAVGEVAESAPTNAVDVLKEPSVGDVQLASGLDYSLEFDEPAADLDDGSAVQAYDHNMMPAYGADPMDISNMPFDAVALGFGGSSVTSAEQQVEMEDLVEAGKRSYHSHEGIAMVANEENTIQHTCHAVKSADNSVSPAFPTSAEEVENRNVDMPAPVNGNIDGNRFQPEDGDKPSSDNLDVEVSSAALANDESNAAISVLNNEKEISSERNDAFSHPGEASFSQPEQLGEVSLSQGEFNEGEVEYIYEGPAPEPEEDAFYEVGSPTVGKQVARAREEEQEEILYFGQPSPTEALTAGDGVKPLEYSPHVGASAASPPNFALFADQAFQGRPPAESFCSITSSEASHVNASLSRRVSRTSTVGEGGGLRAITPSALTAQQSLSAIALEHSPSNAGDEEMQHSDSKLHITRSVDDYLGEFSEKNSHDLPGLLVTQDSFLPGQYVPFVPNSIAEASSTYPENHIVEQQLPTQHEEVVISSEVGQQEAEEQSGASDVEQHGNDAENEQPQESAEANQEDSPNPDPLVNNFMEAADGPINPAAENAMQLADSAHDIILPSAPAESTYESTEQNGERNKVNDSSPPRSREPEQETSPLAVDTADGEREENSQPATSPLPGDGTDLEEAPKEVSGKLPNILSKSKKITLDGLERYVAPQPKKVTDLRNMVQNSRKSAVPKASEVSYRPTNASPSGRPKTAVQSSSKPATKTFLTDVALQGGSSKRPNSAAVHKHPSPSSPRPSSPSKKKHVRYCNPLRFHPKKQCIVLSDVCPHRKAFTKCTSFFCKEALEKYNWLIMVRDKHKETLELITQVDELWRQKLMEALDECIEDMKADQRRELYKLKKSLEAPSSNDVHMLTTLQYLELTGVNKKTKEEAFMETGLTSDHYEFVHRKVELHKLHVALQIRTLIDHKKCYHQKLLLELKDIVKMPLKDLDSIRDAHIETIDFHMKRVERWILYLLDMAMQPSKDNPLEPPKEDVVNINRISKAAKQITEFLRNALAGFAQVCAQIRESYNNVDSEVRRMLHEAKTLHLMTEKERPKTASRPKSPNRQKGDNQSKRTHEKQALRPLSAPATTGSSKILSFFDDNQQQDEDVNRDSEVDEHGRGHVDAIKSYGSDFEDAVSDNKSKLSRINSRASVRSVEDDIVEDVEEKESRQTDGIEEESRGKNRSNNDSYAEDEDHEKAKQADEDEYGEEEGGEQDVGNGQEQDQTSPKANKQKKSKRGKKSRKVLPSGGEIRESRQLAKEKDDKRARKQLLFKILDRTSPVKGNAGRPHTSPPRTRSPPPINSTSYHSDFDFASDADERNNKQHAAPAVRMCFHCYKEVTGRGVHVPKLTTSGRESWEVAQNDLSKANSLRPDHLRKIEI